MDIKVSSRTDAEQEKLSPSDFRRQMKQIKEDFRTQTKTFVLNLQNHSQIFYWVKKYLSM